MLEPKDRRPLLATVRPPEGYAFDCAIGTTYSLDLLALLTLPLAFTLYGDMADAPDPDPLALLQALRRYAERIHLFCQAGRIAVPQNSKLLYAYLEESVFPVNPIIRGGVFHPKIWVLRFTAANQPIRYRLLCLSRNLTYDRSWDTALALDGILLEQSRGFAANRPLSDFVASLPALAVHPPPQAVHTTVQLMQDELRRVEFECPTNFDSYGFHPIGIGKHYGSPLAQSAERWLVMSPFLDKDRLPTIVGASTGEHVLISRYDSLRELNRKDLSDFTKVYYLNQAAELEGDIDGDVAEPLGDVLAPLTGLHAKFYIAEQGSRVRLWTGSANATDAGFERNIEFLVELQGKKSLCGIDPLLENAGKQSDVWTFGHLLQPYTAPKDGVPADPIRQELEHQLRAAQDLLAQTQLTAHIAVGTSDNHYSVTVQSPVPLKLSQGVQAWCWPITLASTAKSSLQFSSTILAEFSALSFEALTTFYAFEIIANHSNQTLASRFVLTIPLVGAPNNRGERLLRTLLQSREQVMRLLLFILADNPDPTWNISNAVRDLVVEQRTRHTKQSATVVPLFESMVQTLSRDPTKLNQVARLVEELQRTPEGRALLPEGFEIIWNPIWEMCQKLQS